MNVFWRIAAVASFIFALPLQTAAAAQGGARILYAPAESDDPTYRNFIAEYIGGECDYFDARVDTPEPSLLVQYDCVHTWSSHPYNDPILFGDRLADYADQGGSVILGAHTTSQGGSLIEGRIITPGYSPVTSLGARDQQSAWDGTCREDCVWENIPIVFAVHRAIGTTADPIYATVCGRYVDGEVAVAFNPDRTVTFVNGAAGLPYPIDPEMAHLVSNICDCRDGAPSVGACCYPDRTCLIQSSDECAGGGGVYMGDGSSCDPNPCQPVPSPDHTWGQMKWRYRQQG